MHRLLLYTRPDCCLCDQAKALVVELARDHPLQLEQVDVAADPALQAAYGEQVPVLFVDGKKRFIGRVDRMLLRRLLEAG